MLAKEDALAISKQSAQYKPVSGLAIDISEHC